MSTYCGSCFFLILISDAGIFKITAAAAAAAAAAATAATTSRCRASCQTNRFSSVSFILVVSPSLQYSVYSSSPFYVLLPFFMFVIPFIQVP
jgi:hypothetical protein